LDIPERLSRLPVLIPPFSCSAAGLLSSPAVLRHCDLDGWVCWNSLSFAREVVVDEAFSFWDSVGDRSSDDFPVGDFCPPFAAAAAAAACCARSFREAFPRFFRSLIYSHPKPNSNPHQLCPNQPVRMKTYQHNGRRDFAHRISSEVGCIDRRLC